jgi:hypothetical protein
MKLFYLLFLSLLTLTACNSQNKATEIIFTEQESGTDPYETRMIITNDFIRIDDGAESKDFILYNRKLRKISSIAFDNQRIFEINHRQISIKPSTDLKWEHKETEAKGAPTISGVKPTGHSFNANDVVCLQTISAKGLLEDARLALIEYQVTLAGEHAANLEKTPKDQQRACDTAVSIFHSTDSLKYGFPIVEWDSAGHRRQLTNFTEGKTVSDDLFKIPEGFQSFSLHE